jgi:hypothetical protein
MVNIKNSLRKVTQNEKVLAFGLKTGKFTAPIQKIAISHGPEILVGAGIVTGIAAAVMAAKATLKLEETVEYTSNEVARLEKSKEVLPDDEVNGAILKAKFVGAVEVAKLYVPAATLGFASVCFIVGSHGIMKKRNIAAIGAYKALEASFEKYRQRVIDEFGQDKDEDFRLGYEQVDRKHNGETVKQTKITDRAGMPSQYARFFDELSSEYSKDHPDYNLIKLRQVQNYFNDKLKVKGFVFLNDVYDSLDIPRTPQGQIVGWLAEGHEKARDGYIDLGIYDVSDERKRMFVNGTEPGIMLDFNVDGAIIDYI